MIAYHDTEWGQPLRESAALFERISLEAFQSGLSWLIILRKRENFRRAFHGFDVDRIARYTKRDIDRLMADVGIVRNRAKVEATIANARAVADLDVGLTLVTDHFAGGLEREFPRLEDAHSRIDAVEPIGDVPHLPPSLRLCSEQPARQSGSSPVAGTRSGLGGESVASQPATPSAGAARLCSRGVWL